MNRKKLVRNMAIPVAVVLIVSITILICQLPFRSWQYKKHTTALNDHINELTSEYQNYLSTVAEEIKNMPVDPHIIGEIQSKLLKDYQRIKLYLWMSDTQGDFVFGAPSTVFSKLNIGFDLHKDVIDKDGHFVDRDQFLLTLVNHHNNIDFSEFQDRGVPKRSQYKYRFYKEAINSYRYRRSMAFVLSASVSNQSGQGIGNLYLKLVDSRNQDLYLTRKYIERNDLYSALNPIFGIFTGLSALFLWFLLPTWVYIDARERDVKSPGMWVMLTLVSIFFGWAIYMITRPTTTKSFSCPECANELNGTRAYCPHCGFDLSNVFCPECQYPVKPEWMFCPSCRADIKKPVIEEIPAPEKEKKE